MNKVLSPKIVLAFSALAFTVLTLSSVSETQALFTSPIPTPVALHSPLATPTLQSSRLAWSTEAYQARESLAQREKMEIGNLAIVGEYRQESQLLERSFQAVTILDQESHRYLKVLVDLETEQMEDRAAIEELEYKRHQELYGKLHPALDQHLHSRGDEETVLVTFWTIAPDSKSLADLQDAAFSLLFQRYPQTRTAMERGGKPMDVDNAELAERIYREYLQIITSDVAARVAPLVEALQAQGLAVRTTPGIPAVTARMPKKLIQVFAERDDVGAVWLAEGGTPHLLLDKAVQTSMAPAVWSRGYDGSGSAVAILEWDTVDFSSPWGSECPSGDNCFLHPGPTRWGADPEQLHASSVASAVASSHPIYTGMAPGARIISAGIQGWDRQDDMDAIVWAFQQGAHVVNASYGHCPNTTGLDVIDQAFDYYARYYNRLIVAAAGNNVFPCALPQVDSPAKGWNVLTVGNYDDKNDAAWSNDEMNASSCWVNPTVNGAGDREKPEVVAPGTSITGIETNGFIATKSGTSFSAPQVAGLAALLIDRDGNLAFWPVATRAIIMASATHNIEGYTAIPTGLDLRDGAGGINAALADIVAQNRNTSETTPCAASCWWGYAINNSEFPVGSRQLRYFTARGGDRVRVAIAWWSHADCTSQFACNFDRLDTDLDLGIVGPDGQYVQNAWSASHDNNYELVDFVAPQTGQYRIEVIKARATETFNDLGIAVVRLHQLYLPTALRN